MVCIPTGLGVGHSRRIPDCLCRTTSDPPLHTGSNLAFEDRAALTTSRVRRDLPPAHGAFEQRWFSRRLRSPKLSWARPGRLLPLHRSPPPKDDPEGEESDGDRGREERNDEEQHPHGKPGWAPTGSVIESEPDIPEVDEG